MDNFKDRIQKILEKMELASKKRELRDLEIESGKPDFWSDSQLAAQKMQKLASLQKTVMQLGQLEDHLIAEELGEVSNLGSIEDLVNDLETKLYLSGPYDPNNAIVSIHSGQGGVEAMDWANMLYRMYGRFVEEQGWKLEELEYDPGEEAGIKEVSFHITGGYAYGFLKHEAGVHRLVRNSPFNANNLRQTSFALVEVIPEVSENKAIQLKEEELEWDFFRSGGKGGQNVNKVSTAVRLKHKPTGMVVSSQRERSQEQNRDLALKLLMGKLLALREEQQLEELLTLRGKHVTPGWGNQIRSYVLSPYHLVKDLRTEYEETNTEPVLDGKLNGFIQAELAYFVT